MVELLVRELEVVVVPSGGRPAEQLQCEWYPIGGGREPLAAEVREVRAAASEAAGGDGGTAALAWCSGWYLST